ncbi:biotin/lipoyl-containing protein [Pedobacter sp.]|uniref:biotin/lipoyl-containing protein n=1 Tax=Pedobacter sp. TaxID=1411316 RepID=UPI003D7F6A08
MYKVKVNEQYSFDIEADKEVKVNGEAVTVDRIAMSHGLSHVLYQHKSYNVEIVDQDKEAKRVEVKVNGHLYMVSVADQYDLLLQQLGMENLQTNKVKEVKAPMPGLVLSVLVAPGQEVKKGDNLLVLEAMKMENIIKSSTDGVVKSVQIVQGDKVEKNAILLQFS